MDQIKRIYIGTDHRGFELKEKLKPTLKEMGFQVVDCGALQYDADDDYTDYAFVVAEKVARDKASRGILFCGSGIGMSIAANKVNGVIASQVSSIEEAKEDRIEHNSNVLVAAADDIEDPGNISQVIEAWLKADFAKGRHMRRINKVRFYEKLETLPYSTDTLIVPTILTEDKSVMEDQYNSLKEVVPLLNFDIAESDFVQGETLGLDTVLDYIGKALDEVPDLMISVHLMVGNPRPLLEKLNNIKNVYTVYIHHEADITGVLDKEWSFRLGLTLNPATKVQDTHFIDYEIVQLMSIVPGVQGSDLREDVFAKVEEMRQAGFTGEIHFDGSVNLDTLSKFLATKPDVLNVGSAIMKQPDLAEAYFKLVEAVSQ